MSLRHALEVQVVLIGWLAAAASPALDVARLDVGDQGRAWYVEFEATLDAPASAVMAVLTDYARYPILDPRILVARIEGEHEGRPLLYSRLRGCLGSVFCRDMERYEALTETSSVLIAEAIDGRGDLVRGHTRTEVLQEQHASRVTYRTHFEPSFWMPHWLVRRAMIDTLEAGTRNMFTNVEARARELAVP